MNTVNDKIKNNPCWKMAKETLDNFNKMMEVVRQYPIKPTNRTIPYTPYTKDFT